VADPNVRFDVDAEVSFVVDVEERERSRDHVVAVLRERHLRPGLPLGHGRGEQRGVRAGREDPSAEAFVQADPRIERQPVVAAPGDVALDRQ
jgi:hypothetical protein